MKKANLKKELNALLEKAMNNSLNKTDEKRLKELTNNPKVGKTQTITKTRSNKLIIIFVKILLFIMIFDPLYVF